MEGMPKDVITIVQMYIHRDAQSQCMTQLHKVTKSRRAVIEHYNVKDYERQDRCGMLYIWSCKRCKRCFMEDRISDPPNITKYCFMCICRLRYKDIEEKRKEDEQGWNVVTYPGMAVIYVGIALIVGGIIIKG